MVLGFNPQFPAKILEGTKKHTIREDKKDRWKPGMKIHFATGVRTKNYNQFKEGVCKSVQKIKITYLEGSIRIRVDGQLIDYASLKRIAKNDGFDSSRAFLNWFNKDFEGKIIHWTDLKY